MNDLSGTKTEKERSLCTLYFYLTKGCNLACRHCWIEPKYQHGDDRHPHLPLDLFQSIIKQAKPLGLSGVKLTGGEPLLHPRINEILDLISREGLDLRMETNGVLCTPEIAEAICRCKNPFVSVSLDGIDAETHEWVRRVQGCFEATIRGLHNLIDAGQKPQIIMTVMRRNVDQMEAMVHLAEELGAGSVKFNVVQPTARGKAMHRGGETLTIQELTAQGVRTENVLSKSARVNIYFDHPISFRPLGNMFNKRGDCATCGIRGILGVLADGSYALCGIGETVPEMIFGHAAADRLEEVWKRSRTLQELREGLPEKLKGICGECIMKKICLGGCIAQNYYTSKDLWAPFWYCDEAQKAGLFPESRHTKGILKEIH